MKRAWTSVAGLLSIAWIAGCNGAVGVVGAVIDEDGGFGGDGGEVPPQVEPVSATFCGDAEPQPRLLSDAFSVSCGGCHGKLGEGGGVAGVGQSLSALEPDDFSAFEAAVRDGVTGSAWAMPAIDAATYDDAALRADFERLRDTAVADREALAMPRTVTAPGLAGSSSAERRDAIEAANVVWNQLGERGSCAGCHGIDPYDLAKVGFFDADIQRATLAEGFGLEDAVAMTRGVRALRTEFEIEACDPRAPVLAPGGSILPGASVAERDLALIDELERAGVPVRERILSLEGARSFVDALLRTRYEVRLPFAFTRWSEDPYHGRGERTVGDWLPEYAQLPVDEAAEAWTALVDAYRADPSRDNLWALYDAVTTLTQTRADLVGGGADETSQRLSVLQYQSVLIAAHMMRQDTNLLPVRLDEEERVYLQGGNELREMDDVRQAQLYARDALWDAGGLIQEGLSLQGLSAATSARLPYEDNDDFRIQIQPSAPAYRWLGILHDPALQSTNGGGENGAQFRGDFTRLLHTGGSFNGPVPTDEAYAIAELLLRWMIEIGAREAVDPTFPRNDSGSEATWGAWATSSQWNAWADGARLVPVWYGSLDTERLDAYTALSAQVLRAMFFLTVDDLARRRVYREELTPEAFGNLAAVLIEQGPADEAEVWEQLYAAAVFHWGQSDCNDC